MYQFMRIPSLFISLIGSPEQPVTITDSITPHEYVSPHAKRVRETLKNMPIVACRIIEDYAFGQWIPTARIEDQTSYVLKAHYLCLAFMKYKLITGTAFGNLELYHEPKGTLIQQIKAHDYSVETIVH